MTWMYGGSDSYYDYSTPSYYTPPSYDYYSPPAYVYTPPSYDYYSPPAYVYTPPVYDYVAPSYDYSTPSYTPPDYGWGTPSYTPPDYGWGTGSTVYDYSMSGTGTTMPSWYTPYESPYSAPPAYESWTQNDPMSQYMLDSSRVDYSDPYALVSGDPNAYNEMMDSRLGATNDVYERLIASGADIGGFYGDSGVTADTQYYTPEVAYTPSYADPGGFYDDYSVADSAQYFAPEAIASAPESEPAFNLPQNQFAAVSPQFSDTMSDSYESPMASIFSRSLGGEGGAAAPVASGAGIVPSASGGFELQTGSGETINLSDADTEALLKGQKTVADLVADKAESGVERLSPTTVAATRGLSLDEVEAPYGYGPNGRPLANDPAFAAAQREIADMDEARVNQGRTFEPVPAFGASEAPPEPNPFLGKMPEFDPAKMEGTRAQYEARQAAEMARAEAGVPANQAEYEAYLAARQPYNVDQYVTPADQRSFDEAMQGITDRGGFTSQWQTVGSDRVMVNDDGTGIGINENGESYALSKQEVDQMIANKQLNTRESGYVASTGGTGNRPGGSPKAGPGVNLKGDAKGGGGGGGGPQRQQQQQKKGGISPALLLGLLAALAANKGKGGAAAAGIPALALQRAQTGYGGAGRRAGSSAQQYFTGPGIVSKANGGMLDDAYAGGGIASLGGYSDGGRLLRGPGDGVSDSIPAMIGKKQPARLADGEFVVPARIVSELGNGSTEAGARKLYAMMDRIQRDRKKSVGKNKVAVNSRADKHLPK